MDFIRKSKRNFQFTVHDAIIFTSDDVMIYDGVAYFKLVKFKNEDECRAWFEKNIEGGVMKFDQTKSIVKTLYGIKASAGNPTKAEWEKIKSLMINPDEFTVDDIKVYHPVLANNFIDRDTERFSSVTMKGFANTLIDKPMLLGHEGSGGYNNPGQGRFFSAKIRKVSREEMAQLVGSYPYKDFDGLLSEVETDDGGFYVLDTAFYMLKDNPLARDIDAGIAKDMSIRFRAERREAVTDADGDLKYYVYRGAGEAFEGSIVWLGAQYGAQARKSFSLVPEGKPERSGKQELTNREVKAMKYTSKSLDINLEIEGNDLTIIEKEVEPKVEALIGQKAELETELNSAKAQVEELSKDKEALDAIKAVFGDSFDAGQAEIIKAQAEARHDEMIEKAIKFGALLGLIKNEDADAKRKELGEMPYPALEEKAKEYEQIYDARNVQPGQLKEKTEKIPFGTAVQESDFNIFN